MPCNGNDFIAGSNIFDNDIVNEDLTGYGDQTQIRKTMPYDHARGDETQAEYLARQSMQSKGQPKNYSLSIRKTKETLYVLTRLACAHCQHLEQQGKQVPLWADEWWTEHQKQDAAREAKERDAKQKEIRRNSALAKLTPEERELLGIKGLHMT